MTTHTTLAVNFDLRRISDRMLDMFIRQCFISDRLNSPLAQSLQSSFMREQSRRIRARADRIDPMAGAPAEIELPFLTEEHVIAASLVGLVEDGLALQSSAARAEAEHDHKFAVELREAVELFRRIGIAMKSRCDMVGNATMRPLS